MKITEIPALLFISLKSSCSKFKMAKLFVYPVFILVPLFLCPKFVPGELDTRTELILASAERTFQAMKEERRTEIWTYLSKKTKQAIVSDVWQVSRQYTKDQIASDFNAGGMICHSYWVSFLNNFNPDVILRESSWEIAYIKDNAAGIKLTNLKTRKPAILKMYLEDGHWKVGLVESFHLWKNDSNFLKQLKSFIFGQEI